MSGITKFLAMFMSIIINLLVALDIPIHPLGPKVDMSKFRLVWSDEFDGDELDQTKWIFDNTPGTTPVQRGAYMSTKTLSIENGIARFGLKYYPEGLEGGPAGWYLTAIRTQGKYAQTYGYFECRAKICAAPDSCSDFWMQSPNAYDGNAGPSNGAEIDIMESQRTGHSDGKTSIYEINIHYNDEAHRKKLRAKAFLVNGDMYNEFHTWGLEWNENEYIFYCDGKMVYRTEFGISNSDEYMCVGVYLRGENGVPQTELDKNAEYAYEVDYVRAYQYKDKL